MNRRRSLRKKIGRKSWFSIVILSFIVIFLIIFIYKINSSVTSNSQAAGKCACGNLLCFNGNNLKKAYEVVNGQPRCCFGWPTGSLKNVKVGSCIQDGTIDANPAPTNAGLGTGSENNITNPTNVVNDAPVNNPNNNAVDNITNQPSSSCQLFNCNNIGLGLSSTKTVKRKIVNGATYYYNDAIGSDCTGTWLTNVVDYCSYSCKIGTIGYGYCNGRTVWQKINENYNPTRDQVRILGSYTDSDCTKSYVCNITPTPRVSTTSNIVIKSKIITIKDVNASNLKMTGIGLIKYSSQGDLNPLVSSNLGFEFGDSYLFMKETGYKYVVDLTNDLGCQKDINNPSAIFKLKIIYRKNDFFLFNMFFPKIYYQDIPCDQDNFSIEIPLVY